MPTRIIVIITYQTKQLSFVQMEILIHKIYRNDGNLLKKEKNYNKLMWKF